MTQRDIIKEQVEQLGRVLGKITTLLLNSDISGDMEQILKAAHQELISNTKLDLAQLVLLPPEEFNSTLKTKFQADENSIEKLADLLFRIGKLKNDIAYLQKAIIALEFVHENTSTFSLFRAQKLESWKN